VSIAIVNSSALLTKFDFRFSNWTKPMSNVKFMLTQVPLLGFGWPSAIQLSFQMYSLSTFLKLSSPRYFHCKLQNTVNPLFRW
jgi:hypothetical protein